MNETYVSKTTDYIGDAHSMLPEVDKLKGEIKPLKEVLKKAVEEYNNRVHSKDEGVDTESLIKKINEIHNCPNFKPASWVVYGGLTHSNH